MWKQKSKIRSFIWKVEIDEKCYLMDNIFKNSKSLNNIQLNKIVPENPPAPNNNWVERFINVLKDQLLDLSYISITTCSGDTYAKIEPSSPNLLDTLKDQKLKIEARTIYELDADIIKILPISNTDGKAVIDQ